MQCFDCAIEFDQQTTASAVCRSCGAALCLEHAFPAYDQEELHGLGNPVTRQLPGRRVYCRECLPAALADVAPARAGWAAIAG